LLRFIIFHLSCSNKIKLRGEYFLLKEDGAHQVKKPRMPRSGRPFFFNRTLAGFVGWHLQVRDQIVASTGQQVVSARTKLDQLGPPSFGMKWMQMFPRIMKKTPLLEEIPKNLPM